VTDLVVAAVLAAVVGGCATQQKAAAPAGIEWRLAVDAALADAGTHSRPILLDMYTDWCVWCKVLDESTYTDAKFIEFSKGFTCAKVNAEVDTATASRYRVRGYPTVLVLRPDGTEIDRVVGYYRAPEFMALVEDYLAGRNTLASLAAAESSQGGDPAFLSKLADRYSEHGLTADARSRYLKLATLDPKNGSDLVDDALLSLARMSRGEKDYATYRKYAQTVLDRYPQSDGAKTAFLQVADSWKRGGDLGRARKQYLDYVKRYPGDEDAPYAQEQADTLGVRMARESAS
jgi:thioredoxin-like negative regulator of GroEL